MEISTEVDARTDSADESVVADATLEPEAAAAPEATLESDAPPQPDATSEPDDGSSPVVLVSTLEQEAASPPPHSIVDRLRDSLGTLRLRSLAVPVWLRRPRLPGWLPGWLRGRNHRRRRILVGAVSMLLLIALGATQLNGVFGGWLADELRAVLGPQATAQIESWFLGVQDGLNQAKYQVSGKPSSAPWSPPAPDAEPDHAPHLGQHIMSLPAIAPLIQPALPGEGFWSLDGLPPPSPDQPIFAAKTFLRPDPARPYAVVTLVQFDMSYVSLHVVAGKSEPGGPLGHYGPGVIPQEERQSDSLVAAFNGGFKYADGHFGLMTQGTVYVPPQPDAATIAVTKEGQVLLDAWGRIPELSATNTDLVAWRQNAALMLDHGQLNPLTNDGAAWGGVYLNKAYTWRSALGITDHNTLIYGAGDSLSAATLGKAMQAAGATMAMQTDINPLWVRCFLYQPSASGGLQIDKLHPGMEGTGKEYLQGTDRDFFYLTRAQPTTPTTQPSNQKPKHRPPSPQ